LGEREQLPDALRGLDPAAAPYPVEVSEGLKRDLEALRKVLEASQLRAC
jgi:hypothetical protein